MQVLINHCWCSDSNWGGHYNCSVIVTIHRVPKGKTAYDEPAEDWKNLVETHSLIKKNIDDPFETLRLKDEVIKWLEENIGGQEWAVGTDKYNSYSGINFCIFFQKPRQALKFIKRWSVYGKPNIYFNYFRDIRRELDTTTNRLRRVKEFTR